MCYRSLLVDTFLDTQSLFCIEGVVLPSLLYSAMCTTFAISTISFNGEETYFLILIGGASVKLYLVSLLC